MKMLAIVEHSKGTGKEETCNLKVGLTVVGFAFFTHHPSMSASLMVNVLLIYGQATLAAVMTEKSPFTTPIGQKDEADLAKSALAMADSDHLTIYNAYLG